MKSLLAPEKKIVLGTVGMILVIAFWISPEVGLLALGGIILMSVLYGIYWFLTARK